jgi:hypothetical protein
MQVFGESTTPIGRRIPDYPDIIRRATEAYDEGDEHTASMAVDGLARRVSAMLPSGADYELILGTIRFTVEHGARVRRHGGVELTGKALLDAVSDDDTYLVDYVPEGRAAVEGVTYKGALLYDLLNAFERDHWAVEGTPDHFKAQRTGKDGAQVYELRRVAPSQLWPAKGDTITIRRSPEAGKPLEFTGTVVRTPADGDFELGVDYAPDQFDANVHHSKFATTWTWESAVLPEVTQDA